MEDKRITAKEARAIADNTNSLLNHIYKEITECAKDGRCRINWDIFDISEVLVKKAVDTLRADGYYVGEQKNLLVISW